VQDQLPLPRVIGIQGQMEMLMVEEEDRQHERGRLELVQRHEPLAMGVNVSESRTSF